jgi:hypothetical protein
LDESHRVIRSRDRHSAHDHVTITHRFDLLKIVALNKIINSPGCLRADVRLGSKAVIPD